MDDTLQKYFTGRDKRLAPLSEQDRKALLASAQESGEPQEVFIDRALVSRWMQQRTEADPTFVRENLDELVHTYFGAGDTPSSAYDKITGNYEDYSQRVARAVVIQRVQAEQRKQSYEDRVVGSNAARSFGEGAATTTISMAEGVVRQADLLGQGPGGGIPIGMMGYGSPGMIPAEDVRRFEEKGYQPGPLSGLADKLWKTRQDVSAWFDVDPEYAKSFMGIVTSGAGSIIPQIGMSALNPVVGMAALESQAYTSATDAYWQYKGISPDKATPEQRTEAAMAAAIFAIPSMLWNRWGIDKIIGSEVRGAVATMAKKQLLKALMRPVVVGGSAEAGSQLLDDVGQDVIAKVTYAPDNTLFTADDIKRYLVDAVASFFLGGGVSGLFAGAKAIRDRRAAGTTDVSATTEAGTPALIDASNSAAKLLFLPKTDYEAATGTGAPVPPAATEAPAEAATQAAEAPVTHEGALYQPEGATSQLTEQEAALLARKNTADGVLDEQAVVELCENPEDGQLLLDAVKGDEKARDAYNDLMAERDADATPEIAEESLDDLNAQLAAIAAEPVTDEDGRTTDAADEAQAADMKELEDAVAEELEAQGRMEGESAADMRKRAKAIAWEMFSPKNDRLMTAKTARFLGIGHLSKKAERRMLRAAREQFLVAAERVYGNERVAAVRKAGWERMKERLAALRQQKDAKLSEVRADRDTKLDALRAEENAKISEVREAGWVRLETKVFELRQRQMQRLVEANGRRARGQANKRLEARVKHWQNALKSARGGGKALRIKNADAVDAYIRQITEPPSMEDQKAANDLQEKLESEKGYDLTQEDMALMARVSMPRVGSGKLTESQALSLLANLNSIIKTGKDWYSASRELRLEQEYAQYEKALGQVLARSAEVGAATKMSVFGWRKLLSRLKTMVNFLLKTDTMNTWLTGDEDGRGNAMTANTTDVIASAGAAEYRMNLSVNEWFTSLAERTGVNLADGAKGLLDAKGKPIRLGTHALTNTEARCIYAYSLSDYGRKTLADTRYESEDGTVTTLSEQDIKSVVDALPQKYKDYVDGAVDYLSTVNYDRVNAWFKTKYGIDMPRAEKYFPIANLVSTGSGVVDMLKAGSYTAGIEKGFTKGRTGNQGFRSLDFDKTLLSHLANVNHLVAMEGAVSQVNRFLNPPNRDRRLREAVEARLGPESWKVYSDWLKSITLGRTDPSSVPVLGKVVSVLRNQLNRAYLWGNPFTAMKVASSLGPGLRHVEPAAAFRAACDYVCDRKGVMDFVGKNTESAEVLARFGRLDQVLRDMTDDPKLSLLLEKYTGIGHVDGWMLMRIVEANQTCYLWHAKYLSSTRKGKSHFAAVKDADSLIAATQQSGQLDNLPSLFKRDPLYRSLVSFRNDNMNILNEGVKVLVARGTKKQMARRIASYVVLDMIYPVLILGSVGQAFNYTKRAVVDAVRSALGWEEKRRRERDLKTEFVSDTVRMAITQPVQAIPILGDAANWASAELVGDEAAAYSAADSNVIWTSFLEMLARKKYVSATGLVLGVPGTSLWGDMFDGDLKEALDSWKNAAGEENDEPAY